MEASIRPRPSLTAGTPPSETIARLVALNASRAAEEAAGTIRWLSAPIISAHALATDPPFSYRPFAMLGGAA